MDPARGTYMLEKLSKEFHVHCRKDLSKRCILYPKMVLMSLNVWPDNDDPKKYWLIMAVIISVLIMGLTHLAYVLLNVTEITKMTSASTTLVVSFECVAKLLTMLHYRNELNRILRAIWHDFWPVSMVNQALRDEIRLRSNYVTFVGVTFICMAYVSSAQFMMFPLINNVDELPLPSWYPFDYLTSPVYEILYIWQWFMNQVLITTLSGFDTFFNALVMIVANQFQVLQDVVANIGKYEAKTFWNTIKKFGEEDDTERSSFEMKMLVKCVNHHTKLIDICKVMERMFIHIVLLQFVVSASAMCVSCVALIADPELMEHMLSYLIAHVFQFFFFCSVGNELTYQSGCVAESAYDCNWEKSQDNHFRRGLIMIILRAQRPMELSVGGLMQLNYANFIATVQLSFSFYVLLDSMLEQHD